MNILIEDERNEQKDVFKYDGGIREFIDHINKNQETINGQIYLEGEKEDVQVEVAMQYNTSYKEQSFSFVNNINTTEGVTHVMGFRTALTRAINSYIKKSKSAQTLPSGDDVREGFSSVISVKIPNPQLEGQTKPKLGNPYVKGLVDKMVVDGLTTLCKETPT